MLEIDAAMGTVTAPIWLGGAASAVFVVTVLIAIGRAGAATLVNALFRVAIVAIAVSAGWLYMQRTDQQEHAAARRSLDERAAALMARAIAPGSALSCLDELAGEAVEVACEKAVFASPEAVAAAVSYVNAKLSLLADGRDHARRKYAAFGAELAPLRSALELDRFGIVAHVLAGRNGCTADKCDALAQFNDPSRLVANLRDRAFDDQVTKSAAMWNALPHVATEGAVGTVAAPTAALPQNLGPSPATVSPRYDFPSSQSIPPINIMVPEPPAPPSAPRVSAAPNGQPAAAPGDGNAAAGSTPVPPRRPPQVRAAAPAAAPTPRPSVQQPAAATSRLSSQQPATPIAVGEAPADGAAPRPSAPIQLQPR